MGLDSMVLGVLDLGLKPMAGSKHKKFLTKNGIMNDYAIQGSPKIKGVLVMSEI